MPSWYRGDKRVKVNVMVVGSISTRGHEILNFNHFKIFNFNFIHWNISFRGWSWRRGTKCDCKKDLLWVLSPLEEVKYLLLFIFSFLRSGVETKGGVEFRHSSARNVSRIRRKVGNGVSYYQVPSAYPAVCVKLKHFFALVTTHSATLSSATQQAMPQE